MNETQEVHQISINILQRRANAYGMALAMSEPPQTTLQLTKVSAALDDLIIDRDIYLSEHEITPITQEK